MAEANKRTAMIVLAYLWPLALIPLLIDPEDREVHWHAKHGLVLMVAEIVLFVALGAITAAASVATLALGCAFSMIAVLLWVAVLAVHTTAIVVALNGRRFLVPGVSGFADRF